MAKLDDLLAALEREACQPLVPGELGPWAETVRTALDAVRRGWRSTAEKREEAVRSIRRDDPELTARAERLEERETELGAELEALGKRAGWLASGDGKDPSEDPEDHGSAEALRKDLLTWIVEVRVHEAELRTWGTEAAYRDRGFVD